jgi:hypothetical protein
LDIQIVTNKQTATVNQLAIDKQNTVNINNIIRYKADEISKKITNVLYNHIKIFSIVRQLMNKRKD